MFPNMQNALHRIREMRQSRWRQTSGLKGNGEPLTVDIRFHKLGLTLKKNGKKILHGV